MLTEPERGDGLAGLTAELAPYFRHGFLSSDGHRALQQALSALEGADRVAVLRDAATRMPELRRSSAPTANRDGTIAHAVAVSVLESTATRLNERELIDVLGAFSHDCGHSADTTAPFAFAVRFQREHGYSAAVAAAMRDYVDRLPNTGAVKVQHLRRWSALLSVLAPESPPVRVRGRVLWIAAVREALAALPAAELAHWRTLVLAMQIREQHALPATWVRTAEPVVDALGADVVLARLREWWPDPASAVPISLDHGGLPLLKHLVWLLSLLPRPEAEPLARSVLDTTFHGRGEHAGVRTPATQYLADAGAVPR